MDELKDKLKKLSLFGKGGQAKGAFQGTGHRLGSAQPAQVGATQARPAPRAGASPLPRLVVPPAPPRPAAPAAGASSSTSRLDQPAQQAQQQQPQPVQQAQQQQPQPVQQVQQQQPQPVQQPQEAEVPEALAAALAQLASDPHSAAAAEVLGRLLRNVVTAPSEPKYRRVRLSNPRIQSAVVDTSGGVELLLACGFEIVFEEAATVAGEAGEQQQAAEAAGSATEGFAVLPDDADLAPLHQALHLLTPLLPAPSAPSGGAAGAVGSRQQAAGSSSAPAAVQPAQQQQQRRQQREREWEQPRERNTQVLLPTSVDRDVPEWFFQRTGQELKAAFQAAVRRREQDTVLMTRATRERLRGAPAGPAPTFATIKVRFPEGISLQGEFGAGEPVAAVFGWVADCLSDPLHTYELVLPSRQPLDVRAQSVREAGLLPSIALLFRWTGQSALEMAHVPALRPELLRSARPAAVSY